jgi:hypothetical protein
MTPPRGKLGGGCCKGEEVTILRVTRAAVLM